MSGRRPVRPALVLSVPSRTEFLALVRDVTRRMAEISGFDAALAERLALAVDEAATNVIEHAYAGAADRVVELRFWDAGAELRIDLSTTAPRSIRARFRSWTSRDSRRSGARAGWECT